MLALLIGIPLAFGLREPGFIGGTPPKRDQSILHALREALSLPQLSVADGGLLCVRFSSGVHWRAHAQLFERQRLVARSGQHCFGTDWFVQCVRHLCIAGSWASVWPSAKFCRSFISSRSVAIVLFLWAPLTPMSVYIFASVMGLLWLSTVPPTNAIVAQIFGVAHLSMLGGFVFFSHQIGSFMGVWLGGYLYDKTGSYDIVWYISIALGVFAALVNMPVQRNMPLSAEPKVATALSNHMFTNLISSPPLSQAVRSHGCGCVVWPWCCWPCCRCTCSPSFCARWPIRFGGVFDESTVQRSRSEPPSSLGSSAGRTSFNPTAGAQF